MCLKLVKPLLGVILVLITFLFSSFPPFGLCSYPFPEQQQQYIRNYLITYYSTNSTSSILEGDHNEAASFNYELGLPNFIDDDSRQPILDHHVVSAKHSRAHHHGFRSPALAPASSPSKVVSVDHYLGPDKNSDDTQAFRKAWKEACSSRGGVFLVPKNKKYRVKQINLSGPCKSYLTVKILGSIEAWDNTEDYRDRRHWLVFENISNFQVQGGGTIDGKGDIWWKNSCKINKTRPCQHAPTAVTFYGCKNFRVDGLRIKNAQQMHMAFQRCARVRASNLVITAPGHSPNTDGIHVTRTRNILITNSLIKTGDDCISIVSGSKNVEVKGITCGPGHGISIGSLGKGQSKAIVSNVLVNKARISGTTNGVRIKTWQGGRGYAKNIVFENIVMQNVSNPIIIDQHYCDQAKPCQEMKSAVQIHNVVYKNIKGTSATEVAIKMDCSKRHRCGGVVMENVNLVLVREGQKEAEAKADCHNVKYFRRGKVSPRCSMLLENLD